jgi:hypothetical protein
MNHHLPTSNGFKIVLFLLKVVIEKIKKFGVVLLKICLTFDMF